MIRALRSRLAVGAIVLTTLVTTACGGESGDSGEKITLEIWDFSAEQVAFHEQVAETFNEEHPGIEIEWRSITQEEYNKTLPLAFQSRQAPDIFYWSADGPQNMARLAAQEWIKPLHPGGDVPAEFRQRWPEGSFIEGVNVADGKTYGFPFAEDLYWGPGYMYLNNQVFEDAGLDPADPPATWSELKDACATIVDTTDAECIASPNKGEDVQRIWYGLAAGSMTNLFFDYHKGKFSLDDPKLLQTFDYLKDLEESGHLAPGTNDKDFSRQQFAAGQAGIYLDGAWAPSVWKSQGFGADGYTVAAHPDPDTGATGALSRLPDGNKYWVSSQTDQHKAAWTFLNWMTQPDGTFVQEYFEAGFGTLAFADNKKYVTDPAVKQVMEIAERPGFRVHVPLPVRKCPDLAKSEAYVDAIGKRPLWEYEVLGEALATDKEFAPMAEEVVRERQRILEDTLKEEAAQGLDVSLDCFTFPDWQYTQDYDPAGYQG